jgi:pimeloyl-ACP methyl ester carboxylesterase
VLIGCGTFDSESRAVLRATIEERTTDELRARLAQVAAEVRDPDERMRRQGDLVTALYSYDLASSDLEVEHCDARAFEETWNDMVRLQTEGVYPGAFASIEAPVLMLHGARDPHPGRLVRRSLGRYVPQLEYVEWEPCGHYPWLERDVREDFFDTLRAWLGEHA